MLETLLTQELQKTSTLLDKIISAYQRKNEHPEIVDFQTLALAAGITPSDSTTLGAIQQALSLSDSSTIQDAINAAS